MSGLPPGRTGIETHNLHTPQALPSGQDYPPAGLGLRPSDPYEARKLAGVRTTPGRTGIETTLAPYVAIANRVRTTPRPDWD